MSKLRCAWCGTDPMYQAYHDQEWGVPVHNDQRLFEFLILESAQAGLSWLTILRKRDNYRAAFDNFDAASIARYDADKIAALLQNAGIVRNRLKILATITNAQQFLWIQHQFGSFDAYIWSFVEHHPIVNHWQNLTQIPARTLHSDEMSKDLKKHGFKFVGSTICYAFMQATGMINDHTTDCFRYEELNR